MLDVLLQITHERANIKQLKLGPLTTIGRGAECNLKIASGEISRRHCQLTVDDAHVFVRDLGSSNGTYLNGKLIPPHQDIELSSGSRLAIGPVKCVVQFQPPTPTATAAFAAQAGDTIVFHPDSTVRPSGSDLDFVFAPPDESPLPTAEVSVPSSKKPDTELDMNLAADAAEAARSANANAGESPASDTDEPTQFLFGPDDTVPPGALQAPAADPPNFGNWDESGAADLVLPIEPISVPATKRRKGFFDLFKRKSKPAAQSDEATSEAIPPAGEPAAPVPPVAESPPITHAVASPPEAAPATPTATPDANPQRASGPAACAASDDEIEPFWN